VEESILGSCMCGKVKFKLADRFKAFYQCHCHQCQKLTGTAFASNLFTEPDNIRWLEGESNIQHFVALERQFSKSFCQSCGSALPFVNKRGTSLIVPAGCLDNLEGKKIEANIFVAEKACWLDDQTTANSFDGFPQ
jgi:hypothetical protein